MEWIKCTERMPELLDPVLFFGPCVVVSGGEVCKGYLCRSGWSEYPDGGLFDFSDITHWMPLPLPPSKVE